MITKTLKKAAVYPGGGKGTNILSFLGADSIQTAVRLNKKQLAIVVNAVLNEDYRFGREYFLSQNIVNKINQYVDLTNKEYAFMKALFQYGLSINQVRKMPGFNMKRKEANIFYKNILNKLKK